VAASGVEEYDAPLPPGLLGPRSVTPHLGPLRPSHSLCARSVHSTRSQNFKLRHYPVLGGLAEFERELIRARTGEGRKRAQDRGVKFGRPRKLTSHQRQEALARLAAGETQADVARTYAVDPTTIGRLHGAL
jgi:DNA invertase Pin-like site-specific DNA recombinase